MFISSINNTYTVKKALLTKHAPAPIGPYSQAVQTGDVLYISGQIAIDPNSGNLVTDDIESETHQVLKNLGAILTHAGLSYADVVSCSVFPAGQSIGAGQRITEESEY